MACTKPMRAWLVSDESGMRVSFASKGGLPFSGPASSREPMSLDCGWCKHCRLMKSGDLSVRAMHQSLSYERSCFVTLTYDDKHLPVHRSIDLSVIQKFLKRFRKRFGEGIKYVYCGEYGDLNQRPHYHLLIFGENFHRDRYEWQMSNGNVLYRSPSLEKCWKFGYSSIGDFNFSTAGYVSRYIFKKRVGRVADGHYEYLDRDTGIIYQRDQEFCKWSKGLGKEFLLKHVSSIYPLDKVVLSVGADLPMKVCRPPKYYDRLFSLADPQGMSNVKMKRRETASQKEEETPLRRRQREFHLSEVLKPFKRSL